MNNIKQLQTEAELLFADITSLAELEKAFPFELRRKMQHQADQLIIEARDLADLEALEIACLGRKGFVTSLFKIIGKLKSEQDRKQFGEELNILKQGIEQTIARRRTELAVVAYGELGEREWIDTTQPGLRPPEGHLHLTTHAIREITRIFERIGFYRVRYPEVDWDWYAFESLNMPKDHPARDEWETFFVASQRATSDSDEPQRSARWSESSIETHPKYGKMVLTPHTSNGQVREMESGRMPIRMINIAKCYRRQSDVSHVPTFHQFEGMYIDRQVTLAHLKGVFDHFVHQFFGPQRKTRLRPHHFRFTEPSVELDISCDLCGGIGKKNDARCRMCKSGWLELGGAGMINHNVLRAGKIDPTKYSGFAFGWGVERTAMMRSGLKIDDIRILYKNDLRFLKQF